jgi:hypothetical protein
MNKRKMMKKKNIFLVKFTTVAVMIGFFSPSVGLNTDFKSVNSNNIVPQLKISLWNHAEARNGINRNVNANRNRNMNTNVNTNTNINRNINVDRNVNINHYYGGHGHYGYYGGHAIVAWTSALMIGSMVAAASMPPSCTTVIANGIKYQKCGSSYYQPFYQGDTLVYKVVQSPY